MNMKELNFAYKVRHALNESLDSLPSSTAERLASARKMAISRKKQDLPVAVLAPRRVLAGQVGGFFGERLSWIGRMGLAIPAIVLAIGLTGIYKYEQQRHIAETAEIDAMVLSDELPLNAYLDNGFNAYLAKRVE